jgi:hypothetical protein
LATVAIFKALRGCAMPYPKDLTQVTNEILALPDVRAGVDDPSNNLNDEFIRTRIREMTEEIFRPAASQIEGFEKFEAEVETAKLELARQTAVPRDVSIIEGVFILGGFFGSVLIIIILIAEGFAATLSAVLTPSGETLLAASIVTIGLGAFRLYYYYKRWLPPRTKMLTTRLGLDVSEQTLDARKATTDSSVREEVLKNVLGIITSASQPFYQDRLFVPDALDRTPAPYKATTGRGLSEVVNSANEVPTAVYRDLLQTFENLPGASIGICGPRGAGKSTLLWSLCNGNRKVSGRQAISVYTAAPVEYETRDFMLHIFSCVCQQVLKAKGVPDDRSVRFAETGGVTKPLIPHQSRAGRLIVWCGGLMIAVSVALTFLIWGLGLPDKATNAASAPVASSTPATPAGSSTPQSMPTSVQPIAPSTTPTPSPSFAPTATSQSTPTAVGPSAPQPAPAPLGPGASPLQTASPVPSASASPSASQSATTQPNEGSKGTSNEPSRSIVASKSFSEVLDFKPGSLLLAGIMASFLGFLLICLDQLSRFSFGDEVPAPLRFFIDKPDPLTVAAEQNLNEIRFQRSYSSGWSGALKIPVGFDTGTSFGSSLSQKQESLPELVERFRTFVELTTRDYSRVIIGIDELDKLKTESDARKFVNEIKAIFNTPNCFYLMSVSENAISYFERRGMPFRDEFDSAFDDIRHIDYLGLDGSRRLLGRRVLNLPEVFLALCHVLSGGLPRDLIRVTRAVLDHAKLNPNKNSIKEITDDLIASDVLKKIRAIEIAARDIPIEPETTEFLRQLDHLSGFQPRSIDSKTSQLGGVPNKRQDLSDDEVSSLRKLTDLWRELSTFLYFAETTAEFFARYETEQEWREIIRLGFVDRLCQARQAFELNIGVVQFRLDQLRQDCGLPHIELAAIKPKQAKRRSKNPQISS